LCRAFHCGLGNSLLRYLATDFPRSPLSIVDWLASIPLNRPSWKTFALWAAPVSNERKGRTSPGGKRNFHSVEPVGTVTRNCAHAPSWMRAKAIRAELECTFFTFASVSPERTLSCYLAGREIINFTREDSPILPACPFYAPIYRPVFSHSRHFPPGCRDRYRQIRTLSHSSTLNPKLTWKYWW